MQLRARQFGVVAPTTAIAMVVLLGFLGIVIDMGRILVVKTELANAADACALAASQELTGAGAGGVFSPDRLIRAENAGITAGNRNRVHFQSIPIAIAAADIKFSTTLSSSTAANANNSNYQTRASGAPLGSKYVQCTARMPNLPMSLAAAFGIAQQAVAAQAVATLASAQSNCAIPIGLCKLPTAPTSNPLAGLAVGQWVTSKLSASATGSFDWIDFSPPAGGASELADLLSKQGQCNLPATGTLVGEQGNKTSLGRAWNTRFGIYKGSYNINNSTPDYTGYAYTPTTWPSKFNAFSGSSGTTPNFQSARATNRPWQGGAPPLQGGGWQNSTTSELQASGADRRLVTAPVVDCTAWAASSPQTVPVLDYACVLMLHPMPRDNGPNSGEEVWLEYRGSFSDPTNPCVTSGLAGGTSGPLVPVLVQ